MFATLKNDLKYINFFIKKFDFFNKNVLMYNQHIIYSKKFIILFFTMINFISCISTRQKMQKNKY